MDDVDIDLYECRFDLGPRASPGSFFESPAGGLQVIAARARAPGQAHSLPGDDVHGFALVLVADLSCLGYQTAGASATNAMDDIVARFRVLAIRFDILADMLVWVELDSDGRFDMVYPSEGGCDFGPLRSISGRAPARSMHAFEEMFPVLGPAVLARLPAPPQRARAGAAMAERPTWQARPRD